MPVINPDVSEATRPLPNGEYPIRIVASEVKENKAGTGTYVRWTVETFGVADAQFQGRKLFNNTPTAGRGVGFLQRWVKAFTGEDMPTGGWDTEVLHGREATAVVATPDGRDFPEITAVKAYKG